MWIMEFGIGTLPLPDSTKCLLKIDKSRLFLFPSSHDEAGAVSMDELKKEATPNSKKVAPEVAQSGLPPNSTSISPIIIDSSKTALFRIFSEYSQCLHQLVVDCSVTSVASRMTLHQG